MNNVRAEKTLYCNYTNIGNIKADKGLITILDANVCEPTIKQPFRVKCLGNDFRENVQTVIRRHIPTGHMCEFDQVGFIEVYEEQRNELEAYIEQPIAHVEILKDCINYYSPKSKFTADNALDDIDEIGGYHGVNIVNETGEVNVDIVGYGDEVATNRVVGVVTEPVVTVEIEDDYID